MKTNTEKSLNHIKNVMTKKSLNHIRNAMSLIPENAPGAMLVRHAEKLNEHHGNDILLTLEGERDSVVAGELMQGRITKLLHSPVERCQQTAEHMRAGTGDAISSEMWMGLKYHSYVNDSKLAKETLDHLGEGKNYDVFIKKMSENGMNVPYSGFKPPLIGAGDLMYRLLSHAGLGICVGVTHDWLVSVGASYAMGKAITPPYFMGYLDALFVWQVGSVWMFYHKGHSGECARSFGEILSRQ